MARLVLVPCFKTGSSDLGADYSNFKLLSLAARKSWLSAVKNVSGADAVVMVHEPLPGNSIQDLERRLLRMCVERVRAGDDVLLLEADTLCLSPVPIFELGLRGLQLFALNGVRSFPDIAPEHYLNSGVVFLSRETPESVLGFIEQRSTDEWPLQWAYYQHVWNQAYYLQFADPEAGSNLDRLGGSGVYNWLPDRPPQQVPLAEARIIHWYSSRGIRATSAMQSLSGVGLLDAALLVHRYRRLATRIQSVVNRSWR